MRSRVIVRFMDTPPVPFTALVPVPPVPAELSAAARLAQAWLVGRSAATARAYTGDLADFTTWLQLSSPTEAVGRLLGNGHGAANLLALEYRAYMLERGLSPATVNRRLAALRSLVTLGRTLGMVGWELDVQGVKSEPYRDTKGPGKKGVKKLLSKAGQRTDTKGIRDQAILRCLTDLALRRAEVVSLDIEDLDLEGSTLKVLGKGRREKERLTLPARTREALAAWLTVRGQTAGPLFVNMDRAKKGNGRLTGSAVYYLVRKLGDSVGIRVRPHGVRHASISEGLARTGGDVRCVQRFSRHKDVATVIRYDDARDDAAGKVAGMVSESFG